MPSDLANPPNAFQECVFVMSLLSRIHAALGDFNAALPLAREVLANRR